jgi:hypothetical protein
MDRTRFKKPLVLTTLVALGLGAIEIDALLEEHDALGDHPQRSSFAAAVLHRQHEPHNHPRGHPPVDRGASPIVVTGAGLPSHDAQQLAWPKGTVLAVADDATGLPPILLLTESGDHFPGRPSAEPPQQHDIRETMHPT